MTRFTSRFIFLAALLWLGCIPSALASRSPTPMPSALTAVSSETRVGGCDQCAPGLSWPEPRLSLEIATGSEACGYESASGQQNWLNRDPIGERGGINLYRFVGNSPLNRIDPFGLNANVINAGGYLGHTSFVVDNPGGGVTAYHFFAAHHGEDQPFYMQDMGLVYDGVHIWQQPADSLEQYIAGEGQLYGDVSVLAVGVGMPEDDANAIARMNQEIQDQEGYYSFLGGSECHRHSWDWFHDYTWGGRDIPTSEIQGSIPPFINGQIITPPNHFTLTPAASLPQIPLSGPFRR